LISIFVADPVAAVVAGIVAEFGIAAAAEEAAADGLSGKKTFCFEEYVVEYALNFWNEDDGALQLIDIQGVGKARVGIVDYLGGW
jgi:hypothetical protein